MKLAFELSIELREKIEKVIQGFFFLSFLFFFFLKPITSFKFGMSCL